MKKKKGIIYFLLSISTGYLIYNYLFTDYRGGMMNHHYRHYDSYAGFAYYLNTSLVVIAYSIIIIGTIILINKKIVSRNDSLTILDERLSKGEISIDEYQKIKRIINT